MHMPNLELGVFLAVTLDSSVSVKIVGNNGEPSGRFCHLISGFGILGMEASGQGLVRSTADWCIYNRRNGSPVLH